MATEVKQLHREKGDTWPKILKYNYETFGNKRIAMRYKHYGIWKPCTWEDYYLNVKYLALGLLSLGFKAGDKLLIIGDNAPQWYYSELAAQSIRGVSVGGYPDSSPSEIKYLAQNSKARFAIAQDQEQVDKFLQIKDEIPLIAKIIYWNFKGLANYDDPLLMEYEQVLQTGKQYEEKNPGLFEQNVETGKADDICAIVYTSGTTGVTPKGAVHTYKSMKLNVDYLLRIDPWYETDNIVPLAPPVWITEQLYGIGCHLMSGCILNFPEKPETHQQDFREIGPSIVFHGARFWESQASMIRARIMGSDAIERFAFNRLMPFGYKIAELRSQKRKPDLLLKILEPFANLAIIRPLKDVLGLPNARICYTSGTVLSPDVFRFFHALKVPVKNLYTIAEGIVITSFNSDSRIDTIGAIPEGTEIKITESGEIIYHHPGIFTGYSDNPSQTAEVIKDGWFYSGDSGFITQEKHIVVQDRVKDIIELTSGDKLTPQLIESQLRFSPYIKDAWVLAGPTNSYISAVIVINYDSVGKWAGRRKATYTTFVELSQKPEVYELIKNEIAKVNQNLPPAVRIKKFVNLHKELDPDEGELSRNMKLRRTFLRERYRELINAIYSGMNDVPVEAQVKYQDGRTGTTRTTISIKSITEVTQ